MSARTIAEIFSQRSTIESYLSVESALALAQAELGIVPEASAREIARCAKIAALDLEQLRSQTEHTGYPIAPIVRQLNRACGEHGRYVHWGATTQDILNTTLALQVNEACGRLAQDLRAIIVRLLELVNEHRNAIMAARTFGGHAAPITFGFKVAVWLSGVLRQAIQLELQRREPLEGELGGVAGTLASLESRGLEVRVRLMRRLGLSEPLITWSAMRDRVVTKVFFLAALSGTLAKIAQDISELASTEIGELAEPVSEGRDASSALPFKANPMYCAQVMVSASLVAQYATTVLQAMRQRQERSADGLLEFQAVPHAFVETEHCLHHMQMVLNGIRVFPERMRANLGLTQGVVLGERYMMALAIHIGRLAAHDLVHEACKMAVARGVEVSTVLSQMPEVARYLDAESLAGLGDPRTYLGNAFEMMDQIRIATDRFLTETMIS